MLPASRKARPSPSPQPLAAAVSPHALLFLTFATIACVSLGRSAAYLSAAAGVERCRSIAMERETSHGQFEGWEKGAGDRNA